MLVHFHTHLFPPEIQQQREKYCARDPWFGQLYSNPRTAMANAEDLVAEMDASGVDVSVSFSFGWSDPALSAESNSYIIDAMRRYPGRIYRMPVLLPMTGASAYIVTERV